VPIRAFVIKSVGECFQNSIRAGLVSSVVRLLCLKARQVFHCTTEQYKNQTELTGFQPLGSTPAADKPRLKVKPLKAGGFHRHLTNSCVFIDNKVPY
jgi:hypothetical protein